MTPLSSTLAQKPGTRTSKPSASTASAQGTVRELEIWSMFAAGVLPDLSPANEPMRCPAA